MLNLQQLIEAQKTGSQAIDTLTEDEKIILQYYAQVAAEGLISLGHQHQATQNEVVMNAFRSGVGLGLRVSISGGKLSNKVTNN